jgi:hypothetical protein
MDSIKLRIAAVFAAFLAILPLIAHAQTTPAASQPPPPPANTKTPQYAHWLVKLDRTKGEKPAAAKPGEPELYILDSVEYLKTGTTGCSITTYQNGTRATRWIIGDVLLFNPAGSKEVIASVLAGLQVDTDVFLTDYPDLDWVNEKSYDGQVTFSGAKCNHYHDGDGHRDAWFTEDGKWPVAFQDESGLYRFTFLQQPDRTKGILLPPQFKAALDEFLGVGTPPEPAK